MNASTPDLEIYAPKRNALSELLRQIMTRYIGPGTHSSYLNSFTPYADWTSA
jgi:hypothetical protein